MELPKSAVDRIEHADISFEEKIYQAAKLYAASGFPIVPLVSGSKRLPAKNFGISYTSATTKLDRIELWFHPVDGRFAGWNIGIACGKDGGVCVVDADIKPNLNAIDTLLEMAGPHGGLPMGPVQETPNGGRHYIYKWSASMASSTSKIANGIDTRGGTENAYKGHIAAWPSRIDGGSVRDDYQWVSGGEVPDVPRWISERLGVPWGPKAEPGLGNEEVGTSDLETVVPLEQIDRMLAAIHPDDLSYDEWLHVGQAINSQYPGKDGLDTWDTWSKEGVRYEPQECSIRWSGFDPSGPVRMGTLFYIAKRSGWIMDPKGDVVTDKWGQLVAQMNETYAMVIVGGKVRVLKEKKITHGPTDLKYDLLPKEDFRILLANKQFPIMTGTGKVVMKTEADIWLAHSNRRTYEHGMGMFPNNNVPEGVYNTWQGWGREPKEGDWSLLFRVIFEDLCSGNEDYTNWLLDWVADLFQDPANPKGTAIVCRGEEGTGKGTVANAIGECVGAHFKHLINAAQLTGKFNAHMMDALFVFADEVTWGGNRKDDGVLKGLVTEKYIMGERKGIDAIPYRNMVHLFISSNNDWVVPTGPQARRWFVLDTSNKHARNTTYFGEVQEQLRNGGLEAFLYAMMHRQITNDLAVAPVTQALETQKIHSALSGMSADSILAWWAHTLEEGILDDLMEANSPEGPGWPAEVSKPAVYQVYLDWCKDRGIKVASNTSFYRKLTDFGFENFRSRRGNTREYKYRVPTLQSCAARFKYMTGITINIGDDEDG